jgi:predicted O-linked N-acetylglucosamine transferase (SPINDLY family)
MAYLPSAVAFQPSGQSPAINTLPALGNGHITFGSFNRPNKLNESVIILWSMLLRQVPNARMVLGGISLDSEETLRQIFAHEGIAQDRLTFFSRTNLVNYLALHHQVDLCLDTFPYGGGATTANAAWMGVPTLSLAGETPPSRFGSAMTHQLGLDGFIATRIEDFIEKGVYWSENLSELSDIRDGMRARFSASSLGQPNQLADHLGTALRAMWQRWCDDSSPVAIQIDLPQVGEQTTAIHAPAVNHSGFPKTAPREPDLQPLTGVQVNPPNLSQRRPRQQFF